MPAMKKRYPSSPKPTQPPAAPRVTHWGDVAGWYDQLVGDAGSEYHREVIIPGVVRLLGLKADHSGVRNAGAVAAPKALAVVDLACGQGVLCRKLATLGCGVIGIDSAEPLIAAGNAATPPMACPFGTWWEMPPSSWMPRAG